MPVVWLWTHRGRDQESSGDNLALSYHQEGHHPLFSLLNLCGFPLPPMPTEPTEKALQEKAGVPENDSFRLTSRAFT